MTEETVTKKDTDVLELVQGSSLWADAWRRLKKNKAALFCGGLVFLLMLLCLLGPEVLEMMGYAYQQTDLALGATSPSWAHPFGTDFLGRDLLTRVLMGGRISLMVGFVAATVAALVGTIFGATAGYMGGKVDAVMMRFVDILYGLPYMFLVIIFMTVFGRSLTLIFIMLGLVGWLTTSRVVRGQVLSLKEQEFVLAAKSVGVTTSVIIFRHLIPNTLGPVIVYFTLTVPSMMLQEAFLSFIGLGVQPPLPSLGSLINEGANHMIVFWWELVFPAIFMAVLLFSLNFLGDGVRDALDPKIRKD